MNIIEATRKAMDGYVIAFRGQELFYSHYFKTLCYLNRCQRCGNKSVNVHNWFQHHGGDGLISEDYQILCHYDEWPKWACLTESGCVQDKEQWSEYCDRISRKASQ